MKFSDLLPCFLLLLACTCARAQKAAPYTTINDIPYRTEATDTYAQNRCKLDLYHPTDSTNFATIVYFHGGGLEFGNKHFIDAWKEKGIAVATANYRLHPKVKNPVYTQDAAAAVAWVMKNIDDYGGDPSRIYVTGHSAGGYLTSMIGLDTTYLGAHGLHPDSLAALLPFSGHTITHFTPRKE
ncbi:MAG: alpha/beta hydrolase, partial [Lewinella sp.]